MNDKEPEMSPMEKAIAAIEAKRSAADAARKSAHEAEFLEKVVPLLMSRDDVAHLHVQDAPVGSPAWIVLRRPAKHEMDKFQFMRGRVGNDKDSVDARALAGSTLAQSVVVYPTRVEFSKLVEMFGSLEDSVAGNAITLSYGKATKDLK